MEKGNFNIGKTVKALFFGGLTLYSLMGLVALYENGFFYRHYMAVENYTYEYNGSSENKIVKVSCYLDCLIKTKTDTSTKVVMN